VSGTTLAGFKAATEVFVVKKQIMLLLGLVLIGTLGLAAGIEASKGTWDYRSLLQAQRSWQNARATTQTPLTPKPVSSSVVLPQCPPDDSVANPFVQFALDRIKGQAGTMRGQTTCMAATEKEKTKAKKLSFCLGCPEENTAEAGLENPTAPQSPLPSYEHVPSNTETMRFIG
jgi:hypothetical protein